MCDDDFVIYVLVLGVAFMSFGIGTWTGTATEERHWQKVLVEEYDATYCDGEFSLEECK